jgi:hypothetical protein
MGKSHIWIGFMLFTLCLVTAGASALPVNETAKGFRISFDAIDDTNMVAKLWSDDSGLFGKPLNAPGNDGPVNEASSLVVVMAGNSSESGKRVPTCLVFVLKNPENTSKIEENITKNIEEKYVRVFDRTVDGHNGLLLKAGNNSSDPLMTYTALYWLDEVQGTATKLVFIMSGLPWDRGTEKLLNTIHVEEIKPNPVS